MWFVVCVTPCGSVAAWTEFDYGISMTEVLTPLVLLTAVAVRVGGVALVSLQFAYHFSMVMRAACLCYVLVSMVSCFQLVVTFLAVCLAAIQVKGFCISDGAGGAPNVVERDLEHYVSFQMVRIVFELTWWFCVVSWLNVTDQLMKMIASTGPFAVSPLKLPASPDSVDASFAGSGTVSSSGLCSGKGFSLKKGKVLVDQAQLVLIPSQLIASGRMGLPSSVARSWVSGNRLLDGWTSPTMASCLQAHPQQQVWNWIFLSL